MQTRTNEYPGEKTYYAANGHEMVVSPQQSKHDGSWFYVYAFASHSDSCACITADGDYGSMESYAGEVWNEY